MAKIADAYVEIRTDMNALSRDLSDVRNRLGGFVNTTTGMLTRIGAAFGVYLGLRSFIAFLRESVGQAVQAEQSSIRLASALRMVGAGGKASIDDMEQFVKQLSTTTLLTQDAIRSMISMGATMGGLVGPRLKDATVAAIGFSERFGIDATTAMRMLARAAHGSFTMFQRYLPELRRMTTDQQKFNYIMSYGAQGMDLMKEHMNTLAGRMQMAGKAWQEFKQHVGEVVIEGSRLDNIMSTLKEDVEANTSVFDTLIEGVSLGFGMLIVLADTLATVFRTLGTILTYPFIMLIEGIYRAGAEIGKFLEKYGPTKVLREQGRIMAETGGRGAVTARGTIVALETSLAEERGRRGQQWAGLFRHEMTKEEVDAYMIAQGLKLPSEVEAAMRKGGGAGGLGGGGRGMTFGMVPARSIPFGTVGMSPLAGATFAKGPFAMTMISTPPTAELQQQQLIVLKTIATNTSRDTPTRLGK